MAASQNYATYVAWWPNGYDVGLTMKRSWVPGRVAVRWLLLGWVTVCGQVSHLGI